MSENIMKIFAKKPYLRDQFSAHFFPNKKTEDWIYTNPNMLFEGIENLEENEASTDLNGDITFSNGKLILNNTKFEINLVETNTCASDAVSILQEAPDSYQLNIDDSNSSAIFIHQNYEAIDSKNLSGSNLSINVSKDSNITIVEIVSGTNIGLHSGLTKITLEENAHVEYVKILPSELKNKYLGSVTTNQSINSKFNGVIVTLGGQTTRHHLLANLNGENATGNFHGLFTLNQNQHSDTLSHIKHHVSRTYSSQLYKGALSGESRGVFTGKLYIARDAQEVDANQLSKNLLLSPKSHVDTRPQLEVYADDVKAAHGATVGQIGEEEIFYLQSRGIDATKAFSMLCDAFSTDVVDHIKDKSVRKFLLDELKRKSLSNIEVN